MVYGIGMHDPEMELHRPFFNPSRVCMSLSDAICRLIAAFRCWQRKVGRQWLRLGLFDAGALFEPGQLLL